MKAKANFVPNENEFKQKKTTTIHSLIHSFFHIVCETIERKMHNNKYGVDHRVNCQKMTFSFSTTPSVSILSNLCRETANDDTTITKYPKST